MRAYKEFVDDLNLLLNTERITHQFIRHFYKVFQIDLDELKTKEERKPDARDEHIETLKKMNEELRNLINRVTESNTTLTQKYNDLSILYGNLLKMFQRDNDGDENSFDFGEPSPQ